MRNEKWKIFQCYAQERVRDERGEGAIGSRLALENSEIVASYHHQHMIADAYQQSTAYDMQIIF
jgi:hypothetical protein